MEPRTAEEVIERARQLRAKFRGDGRNLVKRELVRPPRPASPRAKATAAAAVKPAARPFAMDVNELHEQPEINRIETLAQDCAARHGFKVEDLYGKARGKDLAAARREWLWLVCKFTRLPYAEIARLVDRDHTTILVSIDIEDEIRGTNVRGIRSKK